MGGECNYCKYQRLLKRAKKRKQHVTLISDKQPWSDIEGTHVFVHPPDVLIAHPLSDPYKIPYWVVHYAHLSDRCMCHT